VVGSAKPSEIKNSTPGILLSFWNPLGKEHIFFNWAFLVTPDGGMYSFIMNDVRKCRGELEHVDASGLTEFTL